MGISYKMTSMQASCPICCCKDAHLLYSVTSEQAAQHFVLAQTNAKRHLELKAHIENLWGQNSCDIVCCDNCGFCYAYPFIAGDQKFYELAYDKIRYPSWKWEYSLTQDAIKELAGRNCKLLEIGAGNGSFIKKIDPSIINKESIFCTEYSENCIRDLKKYGIECTSENILKLTSANSNGPFDIVCMFQVLEHMDNTDALFANLTCLTRKHAAIFIAVPNPKAIEFNEKNGAVLDMPPNHIGRWNRQCFEIIANRHGWRVARHEIEHSQTYPSKVVAFTINFFNKRRQEPGTLANHISRINSHNIRSISTLIVASIYNICALPAILSLKSKDLGESQWCHLQKC